MYLSLIAVFFCVWGGEDFYSLLLCDMVVFRSTWACQGHIRGERTRQQPTLHPEDLGPFGLATPTHYGIHCISYTDDRENLIGYFSLRSPSLLESVFLICEVETNLPVELL